VFLTLTVCTCHGCPVGQRAPYLNNCTPSLFFCCPLPTAHGCTPDTHAPECEIQVRKASFSQSDRAVRRLVVFLCSGSLCQSSTPLCYSSATVLIRCSTLCPGTKGIEDSLYCKAVPRSMATSCDPQGHLQTSGVFVADPALPPLQCAPWLAGT
jgi:hypothetical protein